MCRQWVQHDKVYPRRKKGRLKSQFTSFINIQHTATISRKEKEVEIERQNFLSAD